MVFLAGLLMPNRKVLSDDFTYSELKRPETVDPDTELEVEDPLLDSIPLVKELGGGSCTVDAEYVHVQRENELETLAIPPGVIIVELPSEVQIGQSVTVSGPHGRRMEVDPPSYARPGMKLHLKLAPSPEIRIQLPPGKRPGTQMKVRKADGIEISVMIPEGVQPGGFFGAAPPCLMVAVPENSKPGDFVVFRHHETGPSGSIKTECCRAQIPNDLHFHRYFAARLPKRIATAAPVARKKGWGVLRSQPVANATVWVGTLA